MRALARVAPHFGHPTGILGRVAGTVMVRRNAATNAWLVERAGAREGDRVLDIGCGPGLGLVAVRRMHPSVSVRGVDASPVMVAMARRTMRRLRLNDVEIDESRVERLPYEDGSFDVVISLNSISFWTDLPAGLREIARVLTQEGRAVIGVRMRREDAPEFHPGRNAADDAAIDQLVAEVTAHGFALSDRVRASVGDENLVALTLRPAPARAVRSSAL